MRNQVFTLFVFLLLSCHGENTELSMEDITSRDYWEIDELTIAWQHIFYLNQEDYYIYVYAPGCSHCQALKDEVIEYAKANPAIPLYFVLATNDITRGNNPDEALGATTIEEAFIVGWPSLIGIKFHTLIKYFLGVEAIRLELF